jgi:hypothetical protein
VHDIAAPSTPRGLATENIDVNIDSEHVSAWFSTRKVKACVVNCGLVKTLPKWSNLCPSSITVFDRSCRSAYRLMVRSTRSLLGWQKSILIRRFRRCKAVRQQYCAHTMAGIAVGFRAKSCLIYLTSYSDWQIYTVPRTM